MSDPRRLARDVLVAVDDGARTNVALADTLTGARVDGLDERDIALVTELVYGTVRMQRANDWLAAPFVRRELDPPVRAAVRLGVQQLAHMRTPPHAAVSTAVEVAPTRARGLVNAVLRRVADRLDRGRPRWPDRATELSYPDWIAARVVADLGDELGWGALAAMNVAQQAVVRADGYRQGRASIRVAEQVSPADTAGPVVDLCAAPGGKATAVPGFVVACDVDAERVRTLTATVAATGRSADVVTVRADGRRPPLRPASASAVLVDAPCSGLGALGRRPDARWRATPAEVERLAGLQRDILAGAAPLVRPGGLLVYAVCTLTVAETVAVDGWMAATHPELEPVRPVGDGWRRWGRGALILPQDAGTDGMAVFRYRRR